ncbi:hydroxyneurosporene methyltransferase [Nocardia sp. CDC159]|uniref:Hydroxyneurosporene methyltransferase n=1 Tax=Nocardia pulmonis TaxID=2951408 RepID=A0A9X2EAD8_9NOCA|nr:MULTISPECIES: methyltransferase [Nocardia]MCM6776616.1 hydroxyneurosporene methyltransferase [Nocardia pulmonis]MCM6789235.1 hydroxyneurosporene methyltransferase [Nocardia sp. CDC159]
MNAIDDVDEIRSWLAPQQRLMTMLQASLVTQLLAVAAELGIADLVADGPREVGELAAATATDAASLYRVLRALASVDVFREVDGQRFAATELSDALRTDAPGSIRNWARLWGLPERGRAISELLVGVRSGRPAFEQIHGTDWWSHLSAHPEQAALFNSAMGDLARQIHAAAVATCDLSGVRRLIDVGGGHGHLAATILRRYPEMTAVVYDRPHVIADAPAVVAAAGVADRIELIGGDFFASVPPGGDAYLLSMILHDWDDARAHRILTAIRAAIPATGRLLVIDAVLPEHNCEHDGILRDIIMLALHPGRERTLAEFSALLRRAGFQHTHTSALAASTGLLVAIPCETRG